MYENLGDIFSWVTRSSLYAVAVICIILLVQTLLRRTLSAGWSYALWLILLVRLAIPAGPAFDWSLWNLTPHSWARWMQTDFGATHSRTPRPVRLDTPQAAANPGDIPATATVVSVTGDDNAVNPQAKWMRLLTSAWQVIRTVLPSIWLAGVLAVMSGIVVGNWRLWKVVRDLGFTTDGALLQLFEACRRQMKVRTMVGLVVTDRVKSPFLFGFLRPRVLLPEDMVRQTPPEQLRCILLHELSHLKRRDIPVGWALAALQALHWFNPLVWWAFERIRADRELACDALVLSRVPEGERRHYGGALIGMLERFNHSQHLPAIAGILENKSQLKRRLTMITKFRRPTRVAGILAFILVLALSGAMLTEASNDAIEVEQTLQDMLAALNEQDFDRWQEYFVQDDTFSAKSLGGQFLRGFKPYKTQFEGFFKNATFDNRTYSDFDTHVSGDVAWVTMRDQYAIRYFDGGPQPSRKSDRIDIVGMVKRDGRWLIKCFDENDNPATNNVIERAPVFVGGGVQELRLIHRENPIFPKEAIAAGASGSVSLQITVNESGRVVDVKPINGEPLFIEAAEKAVRQWVYEPTLVEGKPVSVTSTVIVNFRLR